MGERGKGGEGGRGGGRQLGQRLKGYWRTASIAFLTRSDVMRPLLARFLIRAAFDEPLDVHAIVCGFAGRAVIWLDAE